MRRLLLVLVCSLALLVTLPASASSGGTQHVGYGAAGQSVTLYRSFRTGVQPTILLVHGGCWKRGETVPAEDELARTVRAETGWNVATLTYRTTGDRWVDEEEDVNAALRSLQGQRGLDPDRTALWGESAGAQLGLLAAYHPGLGVRPVAAVASISGPTDMRTMSGSSAQVMLRCISAYEGGSAGNPTLVARYASTSPASYVSSDSPPTYLANADADQLVPPDQASSLASVLTKAGVTVQLDLVPGRDHAIALEPDRPRPGTQTVRQRAEAFLQTALAQR